MRISAAILAVTIAFGAALLAHGQQSKARIIESLVVRSTMRQQWGPSVVTAGFPVRRQSNIRTVENLAILNAQGQQLPAHFEVAARHGARPGDTTAPIRWLRVTFCAHGLSNNTPLQLVESNPSRKSPSTSNDTGSSFQTNRLQVQLQPNSIDLLGVCRLDGKTIATAPSGRLVLEDRSGKLLKPTPWKLQVMRGSHGYNFAIARSAVQGIDIELTLLAIDGANSVRASLRFINRGAFGFEGRKAAHQHLRRVAITLPCPTGPLQASMPPATADLHTEGDFLAIMQGHEATGGTGTNDRLWFESHSQAGLLKSGQSTSGLAVLSNSEGSVGIVIERFAETAPKALAAYTRGFVLDILPASGSSKSHHVLQGSRSMTTRFQLSFGKPGALKLNRLAVEVDQVLHLLPPVEHVYNANPVAFPYRPTQSKPSRAEIRFSRLMRLHIDDTAADPSPSGEQIGLPRFLQRGATYRKQGSLGWMNYGDVPWGDGFCSLHYDWPFGILLNYLRTGDVRFLDLGRTMARHRASIDQSHDETSSAPWRGGQFYEKGKGHGDPFPPAISHTWIGGLLLDHLLNGDRDSLQAVDLSTAFAQRRDLPHWDGLWGARIPGWGADLFLSRYDIFRDPADLKSATDILARVEQIESTQHGKRGFIANRGAKPPHVKPWMHAILANAISRHIVITGSDRFRPLLRRMLDFLKTQCIQKTTPGRFQTYRIWREGRGIQPSVHLNWPMLAAFSWGYAALGNAQDAAFARALFSDVTLRFQGNKGPSAVTFRPMAYPGSESKIFSNIALWGVTGTSLGN